MDKLKAEIARKKALNETLKAQTGEGQTKGISFIRQKDRQALLQKQLDEEQARLDAERESKKRKLEASDGIEDVLAAPAERKIEQPAKEKKLHTPQSSLSKISGINTNSNASFETLKDKQRGNFAYLHDLSVLQVKQQLRGLGQPATIFGEKADDRRERLFEELLRRGERGNVATSSTAENHTSADEQEEDRNVHDDLGSKEDDGIAGSLSDNDQDESPQANNANNGETGASAPQSAKLTIKITGYDPTITYSEMPQLKDQPCL
eukprot:gene34326-41546_t